MSTKGKYPLAAWKAEYNQEYRLNMAWVKMKNAGIRIWRTGYRDR
jgi:hypothetical protein